MSIYVDLLLYVGIAIGGGVGGGVEGNKPWPQNFLEIYHIL